MTTDTLPHPFPDYVTCPGCGEPEVEVWCYESAATCHACGLTFEHGLPADCQRVCQTQTGRDQTQRECANK